MLGTAIQFGHYDPAYSRNRLLQRALVDLGWSVIDLHDDGKGVAARSGRLLRRARGVRPELVLVSFPGASDVPAAWALARSTGATLAYDAFISNWDTLVHDRGVFPLRSRQSAALWSLDALACRLADVVLVDTPQHAAYFSRTFRVSARKFHVVPVSTDEAAMSPCGAQAGGSGVVFYGSYSPLHGADHVVAAARATATVAPHVRWTLIGVGPERVVVQALAEDLHNIEFVEPLPYEELRRRLCEADVCLGIFGTTQKANRVVPNKVYDALALGRPLVTASTTAVRAAFKDDEVCLVPPGDGQALAAAVLDLLQNPVAAARLAARGHARFQRDYSRAAVAEALDNALGSPNERRRRPPLASS